MKKYIVSDKSIYDSDKELYKTDIGINSKEGELYCSVWGINPMQSHKRAAGLARLLQAQENAKMKSHAAV